MTETVKRPSGAKKIWYGFAIILSVLVLLLSAFAVVGVWAGEQLASDTSVRLLKVMEDTSAAGRKIVAQVYTTTDAMRQLSTGVAGAADQVSQSVLDEGVLRNLITDEKDAELVAKAQQMQETFATIKDSLTSAIDLYRTIDRMPFISLPKPSQGAVDKLEKAIADVQSAINSFHELVVKIRSGVASTISLFTDAANQVTERIDVARDNLVEMDARLANLETLAIQLQQVVPVVFIILALLVTLILGWAIYAEVELVRLYLDKWKGVSERQAAWDSAAAADTGAAQQTPVNDEDNPLHE